AQLAAAKSAAIAQVQAHAIYTLYGGSLSEFSDSIMSAVNMLEVAAELNGAINQINAAIDPNFDTTAAAQLFAAKSAAISQVQFYANTVGFKGSIQLHIDAINSAVSLSEVAARQTTAIDAISAANGSNGGGGGRTAHYAPYIVVIVFLAAGLLAGIVFSIIKAGNDKIRKRNASIE
ncbi:MAG: hypothetical protein FWH03_06920, partial [Firmicutes bacterium]|nr:hypothetical protein [Bacillota bacterium]